jgi:predicted lipoprotein with Yx(FWY)xxD motif
MLPTSKTSLDLVSTRTRGCRSTIFARDATPGDTKANGVKEIWSLAQP